MSDSPWTRERAVALIDRQLPYLQQNKYVPREGLVWFGHPRRSTCAHWLRAHVESLQLIAALAAVDPRPELIADVEGGLLAFCATHVLDGSLPWPGVSDSPWGRSWQSAWWTYRAVRCLHEIDDRLSDQTRKKVRQVVEFEADRFIGVRPPSGVRYDTKMEENAWDAPLLAWASFVLPDHPNAAAWEKTARDWAFNAATTERDRTDMRLLEHQPIAKWYAGPTLHPDYTCENHGTFHPNYQACIMQNGITASAYELHGRPVPPSVLHNMQETANVLAFLLAPDSTQLMITGNDWPTFHGIHSCLHILAHYTGDQHLAALAEANLDRCARLLEMSDTGHIFGSTLSANVGGWEFAFHTSNVSMLADVSRLLPLKRVEPRENAPKGARILHYVQVIAERDEQRVVGAAWRTLFGHPLFTFLPMSDPSWAGWAPGSGIGRVELADGRSLKPTVFTHEERVQGQRFCTEGEIRWQDEKGTVLVRQELWFDTKPDGSAHLVERLVAADEVEVSVNEGFRLSVANDLGNESKRTVIDEHGAIQTVSALTGTPAQIALGRRSTLDGTVHIESDRELFYVSPGERLKRDNSYLATQFDRVLYKGRCGKFKAGEEIRGGRIELRVVNGF